MQIRFISALGNPGKEYKGTRHNIGKDALESVIENLALQEKKEDFGSFFFYNTNRDEIEILTIFFIPNCFMNKSGDCIKKALDFLNLSIAHQDILILHDEMDLEFGKIKISCAKGDAGHNGVASLISSLKSREFCRLKIGIGRNYKTDKSKYVLSKFSFKEYLILPSLYEKIQQATLSFVIYGKDMAMNKVNK